MYGLCFYISTIMKIKATLLFMHHQLISSVEFSNYVAGQVFGTLFIRLDKYRLFFHTSTVNLFRHPTLIEHGPYIAYNIFYWNEKSTHDKRTITN